ncbi:hypothetical protein C5167_029769 [Papaver somniferum]|nr:hypothetical protein C5167_029769 [Papaver somniferum]
MACGHGVWFEMFLSFQVTILDGSAIPSHVQIKTWTAFCFKSSLILHKTKLYAAALAPFKAYEGDGFPYVIDFSLLAHVKSLVNPGSIPQPRTSPCNQNPPHLF